MKGIVKKLISTVAAAAVALAVMTVSGAPGSVAEAATENCDGDHTGWTVWAGMDFSGGDKFYLQNDITLSDEVTIASGKNVTLCLNGHTVTAASEKRIFKINGGTLTLCDCSSGKTGTLTGGHISGVSTGNAYGAGVYLLNGNFIMYGGKISGNMAYEGNAGAGGVMVENGTFTMSGGEISDNTAHYSGGGVYVSSNATFIMNGGKISNNTANNGGLDGGGVYVLGTFTMNGGEISGNHATTNGKGSGICIVSDKATFNGNIKITGNNNGSGSPSNMYIDFRNTIKIGNNFSTDSPIGVSTDEKPTCAKPVNVTSALTKDISGGFTADIDGQIIVFNDDKVQLSVAHDWSEWQTTAATCTSTGTKERTCANCTAKETETIEKTAHNYVGGICNVCSAVDPAHTHTGGTATCKKKAVCDICIEEYGSLGDHNYGAWSVTEDPSETETGTAERICSNDNTHKDTKELPALTDSSVWTKVDGQHVDPTEESDGKDVYTSIYGTVEVVLPATGGSGDNSGDNSGSSSGDNSGSSSGNNSGSSSGDNSGSSSGDNSGSSSGDNSGSGSGDNSGSSGDNSGSSSGNNSGSSSGDNSGSSSGNNSGSSSGNHSGSSSNSGNNSSGSNTTSELTEVELDENVPETEIATSDKDLKDAILDKEELAAIEDGDDISFILRIEDADPGADKQKVESRLESTDGFKVGQYIDVSLFKVVNGSKTKLATINKPIKIRFEIPEELRANGRTFAVIRVHNGAATILRDLDSDRDTVTIETDRFSTYALIYSDSPTASASNPFTGASLSVVLPTAFCAAAILLLAKRRNK